MAAALLPSSADGDSLACRTWSLYYQALHRKSLPLLQAKEVTEHRETTLYRDTSKYYSL